MHMNKLHTASNMDWGLDFLKASKIAHWSKTLHGILETLLDSLPAMTPEPDCTKASARHQMGASEFLQQAGAQCRLFWFPALDDQ